MALAATNCSLRTLAVTDGGSCSITRASVGAMTPADIEALGNQELGVLNKQMVEAKIVGYKENTLETLLRSSMRPVKDLLKGAGLPQNPSVIQPYFYRLQKSAVNINYWNITAGAAAAGAGSGGNHSGLWRLTVGHTGSTYTSSTITNIKRYFQPGSYVTVDWANASSKAAYSAEFKVIEATDASAGGATAYVVVEPNVTSDTFAGYSAGNKLPWQPEVGLVRNLANSVSNYESQCENEPSENPVNLLAFWPQTTRYTFKYSDAYKEALDAFLSGQQTNFYSAKLATYLPIAEQNKQQQAFFMQKMLNSAFYGQRINENQAPNTYTSLPGVYDPEDPTCLLEYKANALGFKTQLNDCTRLTDLAGAALNLNTLFDTGYQLKRAREVTAGAGNVNVIEWMTDRWTFGKVQEAMHKYFQTRYNVTSTKFIEEGQKLMDGTEVLANYSTYKLPADLGGYDLVFITHEFFDDKVVAAASGDTRNRQRELWGLDWSDISLGIGNVVSRKRKTDVNNPLYRCVITPNVKYYDLRSTQFCPMIEAPNRHAIFENFTDACPSITTTGCTIS